MPTLRKAKTTPERPAAASALYLAALLAAAAGVFAQVLLNGFVNWDDPAVLVDNAHLRGPGIVGWAFSTTLIGHYQPIAWLVWWTVASLFGVSAPAFHALSLTGHLANGVLVYVLALRLLERSLPEPTRRQPAALIAAAVFLLHPTTAETVAWASAFPYVLSLTFLLASFFAYLHHRRAASLAAYALSLFTRASAIGFPLVLLVADLYPLERHRREKLRPLVAEKLPFVFLAVVAAFAESQARDVASLQEIGIGPRLTMAVTAPFVYAMRLAWPVRLSTLDPLPIAPTIQWTPLALGTAGVVSVTVAAWMLRRRLPSVLAAWIAWGVLLAPIAGLTPSGLQATADRYLYVPGVVVALLAGAAAARAHWPASARRGRIALATAAVILAALAMLTGRQIRYWRDSIALWTRAVEIDPRNDVATYNLAVALAAAGRDDEAIARYEQTIAVVPDHDLARRQLAQLQAAKAERDADRLATAGRLDEAIDLYGRVLALDSTRLHARAARGMALLQQGRAAEAAAELRIAKNGGVTDPEVLNGLAFALMQRGDPGEAAAVLSAAFAAHPDNVNVEHNLARLLATADDRSVRDPQRALTLALQVCQRTGNRDPRALDTLAAAYAGVGNLDAARDAASRALGRARELGDEETAAEIAAHAARYRAR